MSESNFQNPVIKLFQEPDESLGLWEKFYELIYLLGESKLAQDKIAQKLKSIIDQKGSINILALGPGSWTNLIKIITNDYLVEFITQGKLKIMLLDSSFQVDHEIEDGKVIPHKLEYEIENMHIKKEIIRLMDEDKLQIVSKNSQKSELWTNIQTLLAQGVKFDSFKDIFAALKLKKTLFENTDFLITTGLEYLMPANPESAQISNIDIVTMLSGLMDKGLIYIPAEVTALRGEHDLALKVLVNHPSNDIQNFSDLLTKKLIEINGGVYIDRVGPALEKIGFMTEKYVSTYNFGAILKIRDENEQIFQANILRVMAIQMMFATGVPEFIEAAKRVKHDIFMNPYSMYLTDTSVINFVHTIGVKE
jgi:hypothetical protein